MIADSSANAYSGTQTLGSLTSGNTAFGNAVMTNLTSGGENTALGSGAMKFATSLLKIQLLVPSNVPNNQWLRDLALAINLSITMSPELQCCTWIWAGYSEEGDKNVFLGFEAGYDETGSNKLYVSGGANNNLIYGDFSTGDLSLGQTTGEVKVLNDLEVAGDLYIGGTALTNDNGTLTWNGSALGSSGGFSIDYIEMYTNLVLDEMPSQHSK